MSTPATTLDAQRALLEQRFPQQLATLPSGARVALRVRGQAAAQRPSLVLLHGISSGAASWLHTVLALDEQQHVVAWDAPGYGHSTPLAAAAPSAADYAEVLHQLLQVLDVPRCVLVGHSLGALMACAFAARHPQQVQRLVLISPARGYGHDAREADRVRRERGDALRSRGVAGLAAAIDQRLLSAQAAEPAREWVRWNTARLQPAGYLQAVELLAGGELAAVPVPVEVHAGEADVVTPPAGCAQAAQALGASFRTIANTGHASPVEQPEAVARILGQAVFEGARRA